MIYVLILDKIAEDINFLTIAYNIHPHFRYIDLKPRY